MLPTLVTLYQLTLGWVVTAGLPAGPGQCGSEGSAGAAAGHTAGNTQVHLLTVTLTSKILMSWGIFSSSCGGLQSLAAMVWPKHSC